MHRTRIKIRNVLKTGTKEKPSACIQHIPNNHLVNEWWGRIFTRTVEGTRNNRFIYLLNQSKNQFPLHSASTLFKTIVSLRGMAHRDNFPERFDPSEKANCSQRPKIPHDSGVLPNTSLCKWLAEQPFFNTRCYWWANRIFLSKRPNFFHCNFIF